MGNLATPLAELSFEDVLVPKRNLIGQPGKGLALALKGLARDFDSKLRGALLLLPELYGGAELLATAEKKLPKLPALTRAEAHAAEIAVLGLSTGEHLMTFYRHWLDDQGVLGSAALERCDDGQRVQVAGLCLVHQAPPTARGYHFLTLDDEAGFINVIVSPGLVLRAGMQLHSGRVLVVEGVVQRLAFSGVQSVDGGDLVLVLS